MAKTTKSKKVKEAFIEKKRSGRYAVVDTNGKYINGADKVKILVEKGLIKQLTKKAAPAE